MALQVLPGAQQLPLRTFTDILDQSMDCWYGSSHLSAMMTGMQPWQRSSRGSETPLTHKLGKTGKNDPVLCPSHSPPLKHSRWEREVSAKGQRLRGGI